MNKEFKRIEKNATKDLQDYYSGKLSTDDFEYLVTTDKNEAIESACVKQLYEVVDEIKIQKTSPDKRGVVYIPFPSYFEKLIPTIFNTSGFVVNRIERVSNKRKYLIWFSVI